MTDKQVEKNEFGTPSPGAGECPEKAASPQSKLVFSWIDILFKKGKKQPLSMQDLWNVPADLRSDLMADKFEDVWAKELELYNSTAKKAGKDGKPEERVIDGTILRSCLWRLFKVEVLPLAFMTLFSNLCNLLSPYMQQLIIEWVIFRGTDAEQPFGKGIGFALGLFGLQLLSSLVSNHFQQLLQIKAMAVKSMLTTGIYRKALCLSPQARQKFSSGQIINLVTTDTARIQMFMFQVIFVFTLPIVLVGNMIFLLVAIGWPALVGLSLLLFAIPLQAWLFKKMKTIRAKQAPITDLRVKKTTEILTGIRVIKLFSWETSFFNVVDEIRKQELVQVLTRSIYQAFVMTQGMTIPALCTCASFIAYGLANPLDAAKVFSSMSWFNQLRMPLWMLPSILNSWAEFNVALTRIEAVLLANAIDEGYASFLNGDSNDAIVIRDGEFNWTGPIYPEGTLPPVLPTPPGKGGSSAGGKSGASPTKGRKAKNSETSLSETKEGEAASKASESSVKIADSPSAKKIDKPAESFAAGATVEFSENTASSLKNINLTIPKGSLTAICGAVGSGKSSLLNALIGEMRRVNGSISISESMAYAAQTAWIQNATVKDNIVFGTSFQKERYFRVLHDAALVPDLKILKDSDQTSIGERGINLSGGQKQRINIARLMYSESKIVLLDDPLSAVDAHVGKHLFEKCILQSMRDRTRVLVTHQLHFLSQCDHIVFMKDGEIHEQGSYTQLMANGGEFSEMMKTHGGAAEDESGPSSQIAEVHDLAKVFEELEDLTTPKEGTQDIMSKEDQASGGVAAEVWWRYILSCGGVLFCIQSVLLIATNEGTTVVNNLWLTWWTGNAFPWLSNTNYSLIYLGLAILSSLATFLYSYFFAFTGTRASRIMHEKALNRILACPVYFFGWLLSFLVTINTSRTDTTPVGRIINRFSADVDALDNSVAMNVRQLASTASTALSTFIVMVVTLPVLIAVLIPCIVVYWFVQDVYRKTARELKRLTSTARSPLYNNFGESLVGISTIRAYGDQKRFIRRNDTALDVSNSPNFYLFTTGSWLSIRLQLIGSALVLGAAVLGITTHVLSATLFGLCLT
ncbi:UNVERIFIED_CONTAM: hypothetical protein HDU68_001935 [Siphonaria sp. JEL0065]|nr:hypothetical protein HDU68_001935 [Siphonaria sp. JEL0065]